MTGEELLAILNDELSSTMIDANYYFGGKRPVDALQIPLDTKADLNSIPSKYRYIGMTATVLSGDTLDSNGKNIPDQYWLVGGTKNSNWQKKPSVIDGKLSLSANPQNATIELLYNGQSIGAAADLTQILSDWQNDQFISSGGVVTENETKYLELYYNDDSIQPVRIDISSIGGSSSTEGAQGPQGPQGKAFEFEDFTTEQLESLRGPQGHQGPDGGEGAQGPQGFEGAQGAQGPSATFETGEGLSMDNDTLSVNKEFVREIAISAITDSLIPDGAKEALDTIEEISEWIQNHPDEVSAMTTNVVELSGAVASFEERLDNFSGGDENVIEEVKVDGVALPVVDKSVDIVLSGFATTTYVDNALGEYATSADTEAAIAEASRPSLSANTYTDGKALATADNVGKIIEVKNEEDVSGVTYSDGLYIVAGAGEISKLGVTSATGDLSGDIENLKGRVGTLESNVSNIMDYLYWETDEDLEIE